MSKYIRWTIWAVLALVLGGGFFWLWPKQREGYTIAWDATWHPLSVYGQEGRLSAFSVELLFAIARNERLVVKAQQATRLEELLEDNIIDGALVGWTPTTKLKERYLFSEPYYRYGAVFVMRKGETVSSLQQLEGKTIAVRHGSPILLLGTFDSTIYAVPYQNAFIALQQLVEDKVDGVLIDDLFAYLYYGAGYLSKIHIVGPLLTSDGLRLMVRKDVGEGLVRAFNKGLQALKESGQYQQILNSWDLVEPPDNVFQISS